MVRKPCTDLKQTLRRLFTLIALSAVFGPLSFAASAPVVTHSDAIQGQITLYINLGETDVSEYTLQIKNSRKSEDHKFFLKYDGTAELTVPELSGSVALATVFRDSDKQIIYSGFITTRRGK